MEHHVAIPYLGEILTILLAAGILVPLFNRIRVSPVLGYLIVGFLVGPFGLVDWFGHSPMLDFMTINDASDVAHMAEFGIVFLMFLIGLELSPQRLWAMRKMVFGLGALQVLLCIGAIAALATYYLDKSWGSAAIIGGALALSSTAIVMQILNDRHLISTPIGRSCFSILLFQDIAVVPILIIIGLVGLSGGDSSVGEVILLALAKAVAAIVLLVLVGHYLLRPIFRLAGSAKGAEPFMAVTLLTVIVAAAVTGQAGLSMALGAFLGGLLLAETEYRHAIEVYIEPFKGLLLGVFFMTVGMGIDPGMIRIEAQWIALSVVGLIALKATIIACLARAFGLTRGAAIEVGLLLGQAGEFAFVIIGAATAVNLIAIPNGQFLLLVAGLSMVVTPFVAIAADRLRHWLDDPGIIAQMPYAQEAVPYMQNHILIAGFGRVGKAVGTILQDEGVSFLAVETDASIVTQHRDAGLPVIYGNASNPNFFEHCHPETSQAVLITMAETAVAEEIVRNIRGYWPDLPIYVRARDLKAAKQLRKAGATFVVAETIEASLQLASSLLSGIGTEADIVDRRMELSREYAFNRIHEGE